MNSLVSSPRPKLRCAQWRLFRQGEIAVRGALIFAVVASLLAASPLCAEPPSKEQIARWIKDLGDDDYATREQASKRLWEAGAAAESAVVQALQSPDPEVIRRARVLAQKF